MEHPLVNNLDDVSTDELQNRINDLTKKLNWARRTNANLAGQISMILEAYQNKYRERQDAIYAAAAKSGPDYSDKIDIS